MKIEDYGFIGDTHSCALVGVNGSIDWLCTPRFDSNACFAALLGSEENGFWRIRPTDHILTQTQKYRGETLILETYFETDTGTAKIIDFMPPDGRYRDIVRIVEGIKGRVNMEMRLVIRFDYGQTIPWMRKSVDGLTAIAGPNGLILRTSVGTHGEKLATVARFTVSEGERKPFVLSWYPSNETTPKPIDSAYSLQLTEEYWKEWSSRCTYKGEFRPAVIRSLLTLKGLTYTPTGGIIAAATTSLPEFIGGVRNWDYRYCWLRDATFSLYSFMQAGYREEASQWSNWLLRAAGGDPAQIQIMYGPGGERRLMEFELPQLSGYENSKPVRIGNAASQQFQLDVYGEVMDAMHFARRVGINVSSASWRMQRHLIEFVEANWMKPDEGIWEIRGARQHFTHSKIMAWVAVDRAVKAVEDYGFEGDLPRWKSLRTTIHDEVCERGFHKEVGAFTQAYGSKQLDASLLMAPLVGFLPISDERIISTIELVNKELVVEGFVLRYRTDHQECVDGLPGGEGVFLPCSFWLADCLYLMGRTKEARELFDRLLKLSTRLGLLSEEYDVRNKRLVGNFPQAFSHVGLINTALNLAPKPGPADFRSA